jgi:hypothetical protein
MGESWMRYVVLGFAALVLAGCSFLEDDVARGFAQSWSLTPATFTTADVRMITKRDREGSPNPIVCTEPSPDVAKALSAAAQVSGSGGNGTATGSLAAGGASAEAVTALAGRSTALLGLRDGLYRACEAYANGAIGADAYALVLSRYGQLMTTLFLGQDMTGAAGTEAGPSVQSPPVNVTINPSGASGATLTAGQAQSPSSPTPSSPGAQAAPPPAGSSVAPLALARMNEDYLNLSLNPDILLVACINSRDSTRSIVPRENPSNPYLSQLCDSLQARALPAFADHMAKLVQTHVLAAPVNPGPGPAQAEPAKPPTPAKQTTKAAPTSPSGLTTEEIKAAQTKLKSEVCSGLDVDGKLGTTTKACVLKYQDQPNNKLTPSGDLDPQTLELLGVNPISTQKP